MPSTTPSLPNTNTSSLTTLNREYVLVGGTIGYWYGYFKGKTCYWSDWYTSIEDAVTAELDKATEEETIETFVKKVNPRLTIRHLPGPISINTHPEYFI